MINSKYSAESAQWNLNDLSYQASIRCSLYKQVHTWPKLCLYFTQVALTALYCWLMSYWEAPTNWHENCRNTHLIPKCHKACNAYASIKSIWCEASDCSILDAFVRCSVHSINRQKAKIYEDKLIKLQSTTVIFCFSIQIYPSNYQIPIALRKVNSQVTIKLVCQSCIFCIMACQKQFISKISHWFAKLDFPLRGIICEYEHTSASFFSTMQKSPCSTTCKCHACITSNIAKPNNDEGIPQ